MVQAALEELKLLDTRDRPLQQPEEMEDIPAVHQFVERQEYQKICTKLRTISVFPNTEKGFEIQLPLAHP